MTAVKACSSSVTASPGKLPAKDSKSPELFEYSVNDSGAVAFVGGYHNSRGGLFLGDGGAHLAHRG